MMSSPNTSKIGLAYSDRDRAPQPIPSPETAHRIELLRRMSPAALQLLSPHLHSSFLPLAVSPMISLLEGFPHPLHPRPGD